VSWRTGHSLRYLTRLVEVLFQLMSPCQGNGEAVVGAEAYELYLGSFVVHGGQLFPTLPRRHPERSMTLSIDETIGKQLCDFNSYRGCSVLICIYDRYLNYVLNSFPVGELAAIVSRLPVI
jgi:hypothetical protein